MAGHPNQLGRVAGALRGVEIARLQRVGELAESLSIVLIVRSLGGMTLAPEREVYPAIESRPAACLAIRAYRVLKIVAQFLFSSSKCKRTSLPTQRARRRRRIAQRAPQAERQADVKRRYWR